MIKKFFILMLAIAIIIGLFSPFSDDNNRSITHKLIRFHVVANSDSQDDQDIKLRVRDRVLNEIGPKLQESNSKQESERILYSCLDEIEKVAQNEVDKSGKSYGVSVSLGKSTFPTKQYSDIVLPAGEYDTLKVVIGEGEGKNWWCVMFPPLCFIDITRGVTSEDTEEEMKSILNEQEFDSILAKPALGNNYEAVKKPLDNGQKKNTNTAEKASEQVEIKFKSLEIFTSIFETIKSWFK